MDYGVRLNERKKSEELRILTLRMGTSQFYDQEDQVELVWTYDNDWVKGCTMWEVERIRQRGCPKKDLEGLCQR